MARPRKPPHIHGNHGSTSKHNSGNSSSSASSERAEVKKSSVRSLWKPALGTICLSVAVYIGGLGYLETRVNTPFDDEKVVQQTGLQVPERYWGTYRPGNYFGLKTRDPKSAVFGLMWYAPAKLTNRGDEIRHWCLQDDNLPRYGWQRHDGVLFGEQEILDPPHSIVTSFIKAPGGQYGGEWTARIQVKQKGNASTAVSLIWYVALEGGAGGRVRKEPRAPAAIHAALAGHTPGLGHFRIEFNDVEGEALHESIVATRAPGLHLLRESVASSLRLVRDAQGRHRIVLHDDGEEQHGGDGESQEPNLVAIQLTVVPPYTLDVVYKSAAGGSELTGEEYSAALARKRRTFDERFEQTFGLTEKGYPGEDVRIARAALSNMVGGVGYWYGAGRVRSQYTREPVPYWRAPLYTAVPSRSFFPRGFLWDEGFHGLLLSRWDVTLQLDIAAHWFDLLNIEGWIPREQILGVEASARVPKEFVTQSNGAANPPMFLIQLATLVRTSPEAFLPGTSGRSTLQRMFPRLQAWYYWFNTTQKGREATAYRWRGRDTETDRELNPKTLTSGLDDYPRASHPTDDERHVDLRCWMFAAADSLVTIASVLERDPSRFEATRDLLGDEELLNELHWSPYSETYADYGLHSESVRLHRPAAPRDAGGASSTARPEMRRLVVKQPVKKLVTEQFGYVSLFPMLLKVLHADSPKLGKLLTDLAKPELLWSPYGLRSLSTTSSLFGARNTEHDPPYWRGAIWININYLALAALHHYAGSESPYAETAGQLYRELRTNVVDNVLKEYKRTGYLWEQYSEKDGRGSGCRPFTGWTALVVLIMGEKY